MFFVKTRLTIPALHQSEILDIKETLVNKIR